MPILSSIGGGSIRSLGRGIEQEAAVVPAGTVLMWNVADATTETIPTGWRVHTGFDGRLVLGTANTSQIGTTANASGTLSVNVATTSNGLHTGSLVATAPLVVASGGSFRITGFEPTSAAAGDHFHQVTVNANTSQLLPNTATVPFITTDQETLTLPPNAIIFRKVLPSSINYDHYRPSGNGYFCGSSQRSNTTQQPVSGSVASAGAHRHVNRSQRVDTSPFSSSSPHIGVGEDEGAHVHDALVSITTQLKSKLLKPWVSSQEETIEPGIIVMYDGNLAILPAGWRVCNGQSGTEDMSDFFLGYTSAEVHGEVISSSNTVLLTGSTSVNEWTHDHFSGTSLNTASRLHGPESFPHSHNISTTASSSYTPPFRRVAFIQYKGI